MTGWSHRAALAGSRSRGITGDVWHCRCVHFRASFSLEWRDRRHRGESVSSRSPYQSVERVPTPGPQMIFGLIREGRHAETLDGLASLFPMFVAESPRIGMYWRDRHRYRRDRSRPTTLRVPPADNLSVGYDPARPLWSRQVEDVERFSPPMLLRYEDRNSMGNSIESRLPFLDHRLVELRLALPVSMKVRKGYGKWVLRDSFRGQLPGRILESRPKRSFDVRQGTWIVEGLGTSIRRGLHGRGRRVQRWLSPRARIEKVFSNERLARDPAAFPEAVAALWLADRTH